MKNAALNGLRFLRLVEPKIALCAVYSEKQGKYPNKAVFTVPAVFERVLKYDGQSKECSLSSENYN